MHIATLLFWIPPPMEWTTSQVSNIISFFSALGTVGAFIYVIKQEKRNAKDISHLSSIAKESQLQTRLLAEQIDLQRSSLVGKYNAVWSTPALHFSGENKISISISNLGERVVIDTVQFDSIHINFEDFPVPKPVDNNKRISFEGYYKSGIRPYDAGYIITFTYSDKIGVRYKASICYSINGKPEITSSQIE